MEHTILGANGPVSNALTQELIKQGHSVRLVSRRPIPSTEKISWQGADLKNFDQVREAVKGARIIYMCAGLRYNKKVWAVEWPLIMQNLIEATKASGARLIFFDNVYMYGRVNGPMTENTPYNPISKKGEIRARVAEKLMAEATAGNINATIARAADFYGAENLNSFYDSLVLLKFARQQKAMWLGNLAAQHAFTYVPDTGKALYLLGLNPEASNQIWHLPTAPALTGLEFLQLGASAFKVPLKYVSLNKLMLQVSGWFNQSISEITELYYQYQYDYVFSSDKFEQAFGVKPTSYANGVKQLTQTLFKSA